MRSTHVHRAAAACVALTAVLAFSGCQESGGAEEPTTAGDPTTSAPAASETPEASASPSVAPATGQEIGYGAITLNAPEGWAPRKDFVKAPWKKWVWEPEAVDTSLYFSALTALNPDLPLDEQAKIAVQSAKEFGTGNLEVVGTVPAGGKDFYHLSGKRGANTWVEEYGAMVGDRGVRITLFFDKWAHPDKADRDAIASSVLASIQIDETQL